jgi:hypothetical protein
MKRMSFKTFDELKKKVKSQTHHNDHTGARITIARNMGNKMLFDIYSGIELICNGEGYLPSEISCYRSMTDQKLYLAIREYYEYGDANELIRCL